MPAAAHAPASADATYGKADSRCARPRRSTRTGAAALPAASIRITRVSASSSRETEPATTNPGPIVNRNQPLRNRSGSGSHGAAAATSGHAHAPARPPIVAREARDQGCNIEWSGIKYSVPFPTTGGRSADRSLSVIIPAYNEAENIVATLENITTALEPLGLPHEILVVDDGSRDQTAALVEASTARFPAVRLLKNERNMGFGWSYRRGVDAASLAHIVMVHGDNAWGWATLREFFRRTGEADVIIGYTHDMLRSRTWTRTFVSKLFTYIVNLITGWRLTYYNGLQIHRA